MAPAPGQATLWARIERLAADNQALRTEPDRLAVEVARLTKANARLRAQVADLRRAAKRQAAPFSNNAPIRNPRRPGRKPGPAYGRRARRPRSVNAT